MTDQYTRRPWHVRKSHDRTHPWSIMGDGFNLAQVENIDDARLIAAAPDLLAALQQIVEIGRTDYGPAAASRMVDAAITALSRLQEERI